ncbi:unnamed protein product [Alopecurus aequalis]
MATVRPHLDPQQSPPPPPPLVPPAAAAALPWSPPYTSCRTADAHGRKESVAESCCLTEVTDMAIGDDIDGGSDDDGCGSCVDGSAGSGAQDEDEGSDNVVWWCQQSSSRCFSWPANGNRTTTTNYSDESDDDDPKVAAARRQEEDRKFWEECLTSGYP